MKKLLYVLLFVPFSFFGQNTAYIQQDSPLELSQGWNMFGFSCYEPMNLIDAFSQITDKVILVKDNDGAVYMPEFSFNGIGSLRRNLGYQIKLTEIITDFQFCPFIVPLVEGCMDETAFNYNSIANMDDGSCYPTVLGCIDSSAFNFNDYDYDGNSNEITGINGVDVNTDDGSCFPIVLGCLNLVATNFNDYDGDGNSNLITGINGVDVNTNNGTCIIYGCIDTEACNYYTDANTDDGSCEYAEQNYDCDGDLLIYIGAEAHGGIVFYYDSIGEYGLVAALEDLTEGVINPNQWGQLGYEWGCYQVDVNGADGIAIGTGYQNTMEIVNQDCQTEDAGITAAEAVFNYESDGYDDWYLPSKDELYEIYSSIGHGGLGGNIGSFVFGTYWSSSEPYLNNSWDIDFTTGIPHSGYKYTRYMVRPIRAFGNWTMGCMDETANNYNPQANMADGSCCYDDPVLWIGNLSTNEYEGIYYISIESWSPMGTSEENYTASIIVNGVESSLIFDGIQGNNILWYYGIPVSQGESYAWSATVSTCGGGESIGSEHLTPIYGCTDTTALNFDSLATQGNSSCEYATYGCTDSLACNFDSLADINDGSCIYSEQGYDCDGNLNVQVGDEEFGGIVFYIDETGQHGLVAAMEDLEGTYQWGCIGTSISGANGQAIGTGYQNTLDILAGCSETPIAASEALAYGFDGYTDWYLPSYDELILIHNTISQESQNGNVGGFENNMYWSSSEADSEFAWRVAFNSGDDDDTNSKVTPYKARPIRAFGNWTMGCMNSLACNYNSEANMADGSCTYAEQGYDCDGNITEYVVGMEAEGGIVFYVDSTGERGLVAALEDLEGTYEWGCFEEDVNGADGTSIATGYHNTMDIVNQGCSTENGGLTAAQASLDFESESFDDWYLPSVDELEELNNTLGTFGQPTNIGGFEESMYFSSSEYSNNPTQIAWYVMFLLDISTNYNKGTLLKVRPIRAFGNWTMGCMDSLACNYNPEANMADGSCTYAGQGYDCEGNINVQIGDEAFGGIVFYLDETGQHGLVAAMQDIGTYQWGCREITLYPSNWAFNTEIYGLGAGLQNSLEIIAVCSERPIAASVALDYELESYSDWYLPSIGELYEMYYTIGNGGLEGNIGEFDNFGHWSSTEAHYSQARGLSFSNGEESNFMKPSTLRVRPIRSF